MTRAMDFCRGFPIVRHAVAEKMLLAEDIVLESFSLPFCTNIPIV